MAGVSVATVSRVINDHASVSTKTRLKVETAIKKLNYEPNMLGRNLRTSKSQMILIVVPSISNPFYAEIIKGIEDTVTYHQYNILLFATDSKAEKENTYFDLLKKRLVDGVITMDPALNKSKLYDLVKDFPIIQCSEYDETGKIPFISIDNETAAYQAVKHLIKLGHEKIGLINSSNRYLYARLREKGYKRALKEFDMPIDPNWIVYTDALDFNYGQNAMKKLFQLQDKPTAVFAVSDTLAIGALKEIHNQKLHVPDDMAIIGFDNLAFSKMTYPTLTTVTQPMYKMGTLAAKMIIDSINGKPIESLLLDHELMIREST